MTQLKFADSVSRIWNKSGELPRAKQQLLMAVYQGLCIMKLHGDFRAVNVGEEVLVRIRNPRVNAYLRRASDSLIEVYRLAIPKRK